MSTHCYVAFHLHVCPDLTFDLLEINCARVRIAECTFKAFFEKQCYKLERLFLSLSFCFHLRFNSDCDWGQATCDKMCVINKKQSGKQALVWLCVSGYHLMLQISPFHYLFILDMYVIFLSQLANQVLNSAKSILWGHVEYFDQLILDSF